MAHPLSLRARLKRIQFLVCDVDGVLTDGKLWLDAAGQELKCFSVQDGTGLVLAHLAGLRTAWLSARRSSSVERRAQDCQVRFLLQGQRDKAQAFLDLCRQAETPPALTAYIGDDLLDLPVFQQAGFSIAVANALPELKQAADYITRQAGGQGAVREMIDTILKAQKKWTNTLKLYLQQHVAKT